MAPGDRPGATPGTSASNNLSSLHPYNNSNSNSANAARPASHSPTAPIVSPRPPSAGPTKSAETSTPQSGTSAAGSAAGSAYRPPAGRTEAELARLRAGHIDMRYPMSFGFRPVNPVEPTSTSTSSAQNAPHHHHHHHHHHAHPQPTSASTAPTAAASTAGRDAAANRQTPSAVGGGSTASTSTPNSTQPRPPADKPSTTNPSSILNPSTNAGTTMPRTGASAWGSTAGHKMFAGWGSMGFSELERREKEERERLARGKEAAAAARAAAGSAGPTSPTARTSASPFARPGPTSPTASRATPAPASTSAKPSVSPKMATATTRNYRPDLPMSNYGHLGARDLPSPFERERSAASSLGGTPGAAAHNRTLSGSSNRPETSLPSPSKPTNLATPTPASTLPPPRTSFGQSSVPAAASRPGEPASNASKPATPSTAPANATATSSAPRSAYSAYSSYAPPYMGFGSGFGGYGGFGGSWADRERAKMREKEREREREKEKERLEEARRAEDKRKQDQAAASRALFGPPQYASTPLSERPVAGPAPRIEVINVPAKTSQPAQTAQPASATQPKPAFPATTPAQPTTGDSILNQVAPSREPRPYTYTAKNEIPAAVAPAIAKDYNYNPRDQPKDKRPRMDAAVDDARRGQAKVKRRKEDDKKSPPFGQSAARDLSSLTREVRRWPEVNSGQVEAWLKDQTDLTRVASREIYGGSDWTLAQGQSTKHVNEGAIVMVRVNGAFLGSSWVVRGERGWDESTPYPSMDVELGRGIESRQVWGTDVYTDDSDLGLVLIHAGWIRWTREEDVVMKEEGGAAAKKPILKDVIEVTVRVVPRLNRYTATERNGIRTRAWGNGHDGSSIVVEGVKRVSVDRMTLKKKANRKLQLAEMARQRLAVFGQRGDVKVDHRKLNGTQSCPIVFTQSGAALRYTPSALHGWYNWAPLKADEKSDTKSNEVVPHTIFDHDLIFINGKDRYLLYSINDHFGELELAFKKFRKDKPRRTKSLYEYITVDEVEFSEEGLLLKMPEGTVVTPIEGFYWRTIPEDNVEDWSTSPSEKARDEAEAKQIKERQKKLDEKSKEYMEVDEQESISKAEEEKEKEDVKQVPEKEEKADDAKSESSIGSVIICD